MKARWHDFKRLYRLWHCNTFGHKWRWETIANNTAAHVCLRCGYRVKLRVERAGDRPPSDWWKQRSKRK